MPSTGSILWLLSVLVGLLLGLVALGAWNTRGRNADSPQSDLLVWMLVLAGFTLGAFLTYALGQP